MYALLLGSMVGWPSMLRYFLISLLYANVIGTAAHLIMPVVGARLAGRAPAVHWLGLAGTLFGLTVIGSLVAGTLSASLGLFGSTSMWAAQRDGLGIALVLAMTVGMGIAVYERMRARLDEARESLRARELEIERAQRLATDARLASLESRLHPHFLFNALAAIAGQVREAPELTVVQSYLEIEHARLGERLRAKLDVPDELRTWPVPPLALHTLVQNSVKHVAAARPRGAQIRVEARRVADRLVLSVWDVGPGLDLAAAPPGHGLETLRARLGVLFGPDAALEAARDDG